MSENNTSTLSPTAVELAAKAVCAEDLGEEWVDAEPNMRDVYKAMAKAALLAALPVLRAQWAEEIATLTLDAPPANFKEDNYDAGYVAGLQVAREQIMTNRCSDEDGPDVTQGMVNAAALVALAEVEHVERDRIEQVHKRRDSAKAGDPS